tara:strand:+ start:353 stop:616 length:264 start_codon:yes stop_codon:yes gene_type:complete
MKTKTEILNFLKKEQELKIQIVKSTRSAWKSAISNDDLFLAQNLTMSIEPNHDSQHLLNNTIEKYKSIIVNNLNRIEYIDELINQIK